MEHMRKRQHREVNPNNNYYDKFYIINYLELGKKWLEVLAEDIEDNTPHFADSDDEDVSGLWTLLPTITKAKLPKSSRACQKAMHLLKINHLQEEEAAGWHEWQEDNCDGEESMAVCLVCDVAKTSIAELLQHMKVRLLLRCLSNGIKPLKRRNSH